MKADGGLARLRCHFSGRQIDSFNPSDLMSITLSKVALLWRLGLFLFLPLAVLRAQDYSLPYVFTTFAGASSVGAVDGSGPAARFYVPSGIAIDKSGVLYIADTNNNTIRKVTSTGVVTTLAGKAGESGVADGQGNAARFSRPAGIVVDAQGTVYVSDLNNRTIRKITPDGVVTTLAGSSAGDGRSANDGVGTSATFLSPVALALDSKGILYVADRNLIRKITPTGEVTTYAGHTDGVWSVDDTTLAAATFNDLQGIAIDAADNLYVTDSQVVRKITTAGMVTRVAGIPANAGESSASVDGDKSTARFSLPCGIAVDASGNLFVADGQAYTIRKITPTGIVSTFAGQTDHIGSDDGAGANASFFGPYGVAADSVGNIFITDSLGYARNQAFYVGAKISNTIRKVTSAGVVSTLAGLSYFDSVGDADGVGANARFDQPQGIAVGPAGEAYVADTDNHTIRKITAAGVVTTLAGKAGEAGYADGTGADARFSGPVDLGADLSGNIYVADKGNNVVRKITPAGVVTTLAGKAGQAGTTDGLGDAARFGQLTALCLDGAGNIYVADINLGPDPTGVFPSRLNGSLRKITPAGEVFTVTALPFSGITGLAIDGNGTIYACNPSYGYIYKITNAGTQTLFAGVFSPYRIAIDKSGRIFVTADSERGAAVGRVGDSGSVELVGGTLGITKTGNLDGAGRDALFTNTAGIATDASGSLYIADPGANVIRKGVLAGAPVITTQPQSQSVSTGSSVQLSVVASSAVAMTYQWSFNGNAISGATGSSYKITSAQSANAGSYTVVVTNSVGSAASTPATLTVTSAPPPSSGGGGGGGGGAPSPWFLAILLGLGVVRWVTIGRFRKSGV